MKRLILIIVLLATFAIYGQAKIPVSQGSVAFYADSLSQTITLTSDIFLSGIYVPKSRTAALKFQVYNSTNSTWYNLLDAGSIYSIATDSTVNCYASVKPVLFYPIKKLRMILDRDIADTLTVYYDKRPY